MLTTLRSLMSYASTTLHGPNVIQKNIGYYYLHVFDTGESFLLAHEQLEPL